MGLTKSMFVGNKKVKYIIDKAVSEENFSHAYLFYGPGNIGKTTAAYYFGNSIICQTKNACGTCATCKLIASGNHPDFMMIDSYDSVGVDEIRELIKFIELKPYQANHKVLILSHAERMTIPACNALLKTLEEPSLNTVIILTTENKKRLTETIISRTQTINFSLLTEDELREYFKNGINEEIFNITPGRIGLIKTLVEENELEEKISLVNEFNDVINSNDIYRQMKYAEKLSKQKENIAETLNLLESFYEIKLKKDDDKLRNIEILDKLTKVKDLISKNVNLLLSLEFLMIGE